MCRICEGNDSNLLARMCSQARNDLLSGGMRREILVANRALHVASELGDTGLDPGNARFDSWSEGFVSHKQLQRMEDRQDGRRGIDLLSSPLVSPSSVRMLWLNRLCVL